MKKLEKEFTKCGFNHKLVVRKKDVAIYERQGITARDPHYEVIRIAKHNGYKIGKQFIEAAETYPGNSLWGIQGWTCQTLEAARERFDKLVTTPRRVKKKVAAK